MTSMPINHCGTCTLCCKLRGVAELEKPGHSWCSHCERDKGCTIYSTRPNSCRTYVCLYLQLRQEGINWPEEFRPDKSKIVIDTGVTKFGEIFAIWPDNDIPGIEERETTKRMISILKKAAPQNTIIICRKTSRTIVHLSPSGKKVMETLGVEENVGK